MRFYTRRAVPSPGNRVHRRARVARSTPGRETLPVPELPEVETIRQQVEGDLVGRRIVAAWGFDSPKFSDAPLATGLGVSSLGRRGKYLLARLDPHCGAPKELVLHLGMTGRLAVTRRRPGVECPSGARPDHLRAWFGLDDGRYLGFWDQRRFGRLVVVPLGDHHRLPTLAALGPEPLSEEFTPEGLRRALGGRKALKTALLDQRAVAGVGNIYADEALWLAGISPMARRLGPQRADALHAAIVAVLLDALADGGTTLRDYRDAGGEPGGHQFRLNCYGRGGRPCGRCGRALSHRVLDGRGTTWCRSCQR